MSTTILAAMTAMTEDMTAVSASRRQVRGVASWRDAVAAAVTAGQAAGAASAGMLTADVPGSRTHARWMTTADTVIATLDSHAAEAEAKACDARERAEEARKAERRANALRQLAENGEIEGQVAIYVKLAADAAAEAEAFEELTEACEAWAAAAANASAHGVRLAAREDEVHAPVGQAIAAGGGQAWIADDKHFNTGGA